jgi:hypothetical protein
MKQHCINIKVHAAIPTALAVTEAACTAVLAGPNKLPDKTINPIVRYLGYREYLGMQVVHHTSSGHSGASDCDCDG